jgi:hypothetical protein
MIIRKIDSSSESSAICGRICLRQQKCSTYQTACQCRYCKTYNINILQAMTVNQPTMHIAVPKSKYEFMPCAAVAHFSQVPYLCSLFLFHSRYIHTPLSLFCPSFTLTTHPCLLSLITHSSHIVRALQYS